jgi:hypothetical protein
MERENGVFFMLRKVVQTQNSMKRTERKTICTICETRMLYNTVAFSAYSGLKFNQ